MPIFLSNIIYVLTFMFSKESYRHKTYFLIFRGLLRLTGWSWEYEFYHVLKEMWTRSSQPEMFLEKGVLKICSKFTGEHPCRTTLRHGCSPVNLLHIFRTPFLKNTYEWLLLVDLPNNLVWLICQNNVKVITIWKSKVAENLTACWKKYLLFNWGCLIFIRF